MKSVQENRYLSMVLLLLLLTSGNSLRAQTWELFHVQGNLNIGGIPVDGSVSFEYEIWSAETGGVQLQVVSDNYGTANDVSVVSGKYVLEIRVSPLVLSRMGRNPLFVELQILPEGSGGWVTLSPRRRLAAVPAAIQCRHTEALPPGVTITIYNQQEEPPGWLRLDGRRICSPGSTTCAQFASQNPPCTTCDPAYLDLVRLLAGAPAFSAVLPNNSGVFVKY